MVPTAPRFKTNAGLALRAKADSHTRKPRDFLRLCPSHQETGWVFFDVEGTIRYKRTKSVHITAHDGRMKMMVSSLSKALLVALLGIFVATSGACGSNDAASPADSGSAGAGLSRFVGTWHPSSGSITYLCSGETFTEPVVDNLTWGAGVGSDLVQTSGTCVLRANVTASTAAALPSQTCTEVDGTLTTVLAVAAYTFSLSADGLTATESASGTATLSESGLTGTCTFSGMVSYQKISN